MVKTSNWRLAIMNAIGVLLGVPFRIRGGGWMGAYNTDFDNGEDYYDFDEK